MAILLNAQLFDDSPLGAKSDQELNSQSSEGTITGGPEDHYEVDDHDSRLNTHGISPIIGRVIGRAHPEVKGSVDSDDEDTNLTQALSNGPPRHYNHARFEGDGNIPLDQEVENRRDFPECFNEATPLGPNPEDNEIRGKEFDEDDQTLGISHNQRLLLELSLNFPFGQTANHVPPKEIHDSFDYLRLKMQHNTTSRFVDDMFKACLRNNPGFKAMTIDKTLRQLQDYTGKTHVFPIFIGIES